MKKQNFKDDSIYCVDSETISLGSGETYLAKPGLIQQAKEFFPHGSEVNIGISEEGEILSIARGVSWEKNKR